MPVFDMGYRAYEGGTRSRLFRWWPIVWRCFRTSVRWPFILALVIGSIPLFMRMLQAYAIGLANDPAQQLTRFEARIAQALSRAMPETFTFGDPLFSSLLALEILPTVLVVWFVGAGQIAEDFRSGALQIYFAKPITQIDYILGKLGAVMIAALCMTLLPGLLLFLTVVAFAPDWEWLTGNPLLPLKILGFSALISLVLSSVVLAISSFARSGRMAGLTFFGLYIFSAVLGHVLPAIFDSSAWNAVYLKGSLDGAGHSIFPGSPVPTVDPSTAWLVLTGIVIASLLTFIRKVEAVEVVS